MYICLLVLFLGSARRCSWRCGLGFRWWCASANKTSAIVLGGVAYGSGGGVHRLIRPQPRCGVAGCVRFSSQASDFVVGAGSFYLSCIFVGVQVRFLFLRAVSGDDGFMRNVLTSSLRRGGSCESSRFCGALVPVVGRCASGGRTGSRRSWR
jgi:hypothetical protein